MRYLLIIIFMQLCIAASAQRVFETRLELSDPQLHQSSYSYVNEEKNEIIIAVKDQGAVHFYQLDDHFNIKGEISVTVPDQLKIRDFVGCTFVENRYYVYYRAGGKDNVGAFMPDFDRSRISWTGIRIDLDKKEEVIAGYSYQNVFYLWTVFAKSPHIKVYQAAGDSVRHTLFETSRENFENITTGKEVRLGLVHPDFPVGYGAAVEMNKLYIAGKPLLTIDTKEATDLFEFDFETGIAKETSVAYEEPQWKAGVKQNSFYHNNFLIQTKGDYQQLKIHIKNPDENRIVKEYIICDNMPSPFPQPLLMTSGKYTYTQEYVRVKNIKKFLNTLYRARLIPMVEGSGENAAFTVGMVYESVDPALQAFLGLTAGVAIGLSDLSDFARLAMIPAAVALDEVFRMGRLKYATARINENFEFEEEKTPLHIYIQLRDYVQRLTRNGEQPIGAPTIFRLNGVYHFGYYQATGVFSQFYIVKCEPEFYE